MHNYYKKETHKNIASIHAKKIFSVFYVMKINRICIVIHLEKFYLMFYKNEDKFLSIQLSVIVCICFQAAPSALCLSWFVLFRRHEKEWITEGAREPSRHSGRTERKSTYANVNGMFTRKMGKRDIFSRNVDSLFQRHEKEWIDERVLGTIPALFPIIFLCAAVYCRRP